MKTIKTYITRSVKQPLFRFFVEDRIGASHKDNRRIYLNIQHEQLIEEQGEGLYEIVYDPREKIFNTNHCWALRIKKVGK